MGDCEGLSATRKIFLAGSWKDGVQTKELTYSWSSPDNADDPSLARNGESTEMANPAASEEKGSRWIIKRILELERRLTVDDEWDEKVESGRIVGVEVVSVGIGGRGQGRAKPCRASLMQMDR